MKDTEFLITYDSCFSGCDEFTLSGYDDLDELFDAIFDELMDIVLDDDEIEVEVTNLDSDEHVAQLVIYGSEGYDSICF